MTMSQKETTVLGFVTLLAVLWAIWVLFGERPAPPPSSRALFPVLDQKIDQVGRITVTGPDNSVSMVKRDGVWQVGERRWYPARRDQVVELLRGIVAAERLQEKTADPDLLPKVGLGEENAKLLRLLDAKGQPLAVLYVGQRETGSVDRDSETFVRRPEEAASWTVSGLPRLSPDPIDWLDKDVFDMNRARVAELSVVHPDGEGVRIVRDAETGDFVPADLAEGETVVPGGKAGAAVTALTFINLKDVAPAKDKSFEAEPVRVTLTAKDGLVVTARVWPRDDAAWVALDASVDGARVAAEGDEGAEARRAEIEQEAQTLNARWSGWIYALPAYKGEDLTPRRGDLIDAETGTDTEAREASQPEAGEPRP
ncbi:hypothetical protein CCR80_13075 [Rhodothalassium salexigens]|uniref:DUF4340 domain-containing protein n=1 Tax=Rhodothalassium salexigens TaxID=1086 RepID=UPI001913A8A1|nr:DUF4340 domain-containing protein [Rhodothalassium salexigens]MBK5921966.1 hypothetical protein [Rhodothalassium salexigens]